MSDDLDQWRGWTARNLPTGEVELTVKLSWFDAGFRTWGLAFVAFGVGVLALFDHRPLPAFAVVAWLLGIGLVVYARLRSGKQVWWLKPGMATQNARRKGEAAYFVNEVRLVHGKDSEGAAVPSLQLVTPAKRVMVGWKLLPEATLRAVGQRMAKVLEVQFRETDE